MHSLDVPHLLAQLQLSHCQFLGQPPSLYLCPWLEGRRINTHVHATLESLPVGAQPLMGIAARAGFNCVVYLCHVWLLLVWEHARNWSLNCWPASELQACAHHVACVHFSSRGCLNTPAHAHAHTHKSMHADKWELHFSVRNTCS